MNASTTTGNESVPEDPIDRSPARLSSAVAIGSALLAILVLPSVLSVLLGIPGTALLGTGALRGNRRHVSYGTVGLLVATTIAAVQGAGPAVVVPTTILTLLAWDLGRYGITIGEQLGRDADTKAIEIAHATLTASIGVAGGAVAYAATLLVSGDQPTLALALLLFGGVVILSTLE